MNMTYEWALLCRFWPRQSDLVTAGLGGFVNELIGIHQYLSWLESLPVVGGNRA